MLGISFFDHARKYITGFGIRCLREAKETNVKAFREQHQGATYRQLAQAAELTNETVNRIERADEPRTVYPLTARKLADALGVG